MVAGSCLCGRFSFELDGGVSFMSHCHCSYCRKLHGAAFVTWAVAPDLHWRQRGDATSYDSSPGFRREFCAECGSKLPSESEDGQAFLPVGLLAGDPGARPQSHMFTRFKAPWFEIRDSLPRFESSPPDLPDPGLPTPPRPSEASAGAVAGSCLCGAIAFEYAGDPARMVHCHCSRCRRARGAAFATNLWLEPDGFRWLRGEDRVRTYRLLDAERFGTTFCEVCGSPMPAVWPDGAALIAAAALDDDPGVRPQLHIFVGSRAPWDEIHDDLPQFEAGPPPRWLAPTWISRDRR